MGFKEVNDYVGRATQRLEKAVFGDYLSRNIMNERQMVAGGLVALMPCTFGCSPSQRYIEITKEESLDNLKMTTNEIFNKGYDGKVFFPTTNVKTNPTLDTSIVSIGRDSTGVFFEEMPLDGKKVITYNLENGPNSTKVKSITVKNEADTTGRTYDANSPLGRNILAKGSVRANNIVAKVEEYMSFNTKEEAESVFK